mgnify:CR=1 FL=1
MMGLQWMILVERIGSFKKGKYISLVLYKCPNTYVSQVSVR